LDGRPYIYRDVYATKRSICLLRIHANNNGEIKPLQFGNVSSIKWSVHASIWTDSHSITYANSITYSNSDSDSDTYANANSDTYANSNTAPSDSDA
jgi:hypothetical protein